MQVAENIHTPAAAFMLLAADENQMIRTTVAENRAAPLSAFWLLAADHTEWVRLTVADTL